MIALAAILALILGSAGGILLYRYDFKASDSTSERGATTGARLGLPLLVMAFGFLLTTVLVALQ